MKWLPRIQLLPDTPKPNQSESQEGLIEERNKTLQEPASDIYSLDKLEVRTCACLLRGGGRGRGICKGRSKLPPSACC